MSKLWAKKNKKGEIEQSLQEHLFKAVEIFKEYEIKYKNLMPDDIFWQYSFLSVLFHDFGKVCRNFQEQNRNNHIRHEFISGIYLYLLVDSVIVDTNLSLLAIFSHHKKLYDGLFQDDKYKEIKINEFDIAELTSFIEKKINNYECKISLKIDFDQCNKIFLKEKKLDRLYKLFINFYFSCFENICFKDRKKYIFYKAILTIADWISSSNKNLHKVLEYDNFFLKNKIVENLKQNNKEKIANNFEFRKFQIDSQENTNIIAVAPTGSGKTEAALLWAAKKQKNDKIIYLLPTKVTSNAIYNRLNKYFGKENTSIIHSSAYLFIKDRDDDYNKLNYLHDKVFFKNINVCTIDQILTQGFNLGYWELKTFNMLNARIIIDEIHLYEPYTLGLIIETIKYLKNEFNAKFFIMSATMPYKLKKLLEVTLNNDYKLVKDIELLDSSRNRFEVRNFLIDELNEEIIQAIKGNKKILIVLNTVDEAIRIYEKYKNFANVMCYHARFIQKHRIRKEKVIEKMERKNSPFILISTQVVEVSLDIDFDILFTENAPIDAIVQRAGRINRKRDKENTKVIIFKHTQIAEKNIYNKKILDKTFENLELNHNKKLTEKELLKLIDKVYENYDLENDENYAKGIKIYKEIQEQFSYIKDYSESENVLTREGLDTKNVIPECFENEIKNLKEEDKTRYELTISKRRYDLLKKEKNILKEGKYSYKKGLLFFEKEDLQKFL